MYSVTVKPGGGAVSIMELTPSSNITFLNHGVSSGLSIQIGYSHNCISTLRLYSFTQLEEVKVNFFFQD